MWSARNGRSRKPGPDGRHMASQPTRGGIRHAERCVAHELGHYIMDKGNSAHVADDSVYLMYLDAHDEKREITRSEADRVRNNQVKPWDTNP